jgi:hypothetical protein
MLAKILGVTIALLVPQVETSLTVEYGGKKYDFRVTEQDLKLAPTWQPNQENPPLSPRRAIESASKQLATLLPNGKDWRLYQITLKPVENYWIYLVEFLEPAASGTTGRQTSAGFQIIVLMNGVAVVPKVQ